MQQHNLLEMWREGTLLAALATLLTDHPHGVVIIENDRLRASDVSGHPMAGASGHGGNATKNSDEAAAATRRFALRGYRGYCGTHCMI